MSKALRASVLVLLLACSAQAGWIQNEAPAPPPPEPATTAQEPAESGTATGETPAGTADILTQFVSDVFAVLPSLL